MPITISARDEILAALKTSGGWKIFQTSENQILSAQWRRRIVTVKFRPNGQIDKLFFRQPAAFNTEILREEYRGARKREAALAFIRGDKKQQTSNA